jgi:hypothetical protein
MLGWRSGLKLEFGGSTDLPISWDIRYQLAAGDFRRASLISKLSVSKLGPSGIGFGSDDVYRYKPAISFRILTVAVTLLCRSLKKPQCRMGYMRNLAVIFSFGQGL